MRLAPATESDLEVLRALNEAAVPAVNGVPPATLRRLWGLAELFPVAHGDGAPLGLLVLLRPGMDYESPNYRWFAGRYAGLLYVARLVVEAGARRHGVARALYGEPWQRACRRRAALACEVNLEPPNPGSLASHRRFGFQQVGVQDTEGGSKIVSLMLRRPR
jgi:predicted GNAT superfamily acetyltransferase